MKNMNIILCVLASTVFSFIGAYEKPSVTNQMLERCPCLGDEDKKDLACKCKEKHMFEEIVNIHELA